MSMVGRLTTSAKAEQLMFNRMKFSSSVSASASTWRLHMVDCLLLAVGQCKLGCCHLLAACFDLNRHTC